MTGDKGSGPPAATGGPPGSSDPPFIQASLNVGFQKPKFSGKGRMWSWLTDSDYATDEL